MRLVPLAVLLLVAGCREAPREITAADLQGDWVRTQRRVVGGEVTYQDITRGKEDAFTIRGDSVLDPIGAIYSRTEPADFKAWRTPDPSDRSG